MGGWLWTERWVVVGNLEQRDGSLSVIFEQRDGQLVAFGQRDGQVVASERWADSWLWIER